VLVIANILVYKNRKGENKCSGLPCAGITLIRFNGFDLSLGNFASAPRELETKLYELTVIQCNQSFFIFNVT
jgi:hypothetical protein